MSQPPTASAAPDALIGKVIHPRPDDATMAKAQSDVVTICSVYPAPLERQMLLGYRGGMTTFKLPPVPAGKFAVLPVTSGYVLNTADMGPDLPPEEVPRPLPALAIAEELIREWAGDQPANASGGTIGVGIIAGNLPTEEELTQLRDGQVAHLKWIVSKAGDLYREGKQTHIKQRHRQALEWLVGEPDEHEYPWYLRYDPAKMKDCPACFTKIPRQATVCRQCNVNLPKHYLEIGENPPSWDTTTIKVFQRLVARKGP